MYSLKMRLLLEVNISEYEYNYNSWLKIQEVKVLIHIRKIFVLVWLDTWILLYIYPFACLFNHTKYFINILKKLHKNSDCPV